MGEWERCATRKKSDVKTVRASHVFTPHFTRATDSLDKNHRVRLDAKPNTQHEPARRSCHHHQHEPTKWLALHHHQQTHPPTRATTTCQPYRPKSSKTSPPASTPPTSPTKTSITSTVTTPAPLTKPPKTTTSPASPEPANVSTSRQTTGLTTSYTSTVP